MIVMMVHLILLLMVFFRLMACVAIPVNMNSMGTCKINCGFC